MRAAFQSPAVIRPCIASSSSNALSTSGSPAYTSPNFCRYPCSSARSRISSGKSVHLKEKVWSPSTALKVITPSVTDLSIRFVFVAMVTCLRFWVPGIPPGLRPAHCADGEEYARSGARLQLPFVGKIRPTHGGTCLHARKRGCPEVCPFPRGHDQLA